MYQHRYRLHAPVLRVPLILQLPPQRDSGGSAVPRGQSGGAAPQAGTCHQGRADVPASRNASLGHQI